MDPPNCCTAESGPADDVSSEQWCICFNCMYRAEQNVNAPVSRYMYKPKHTIFILNGIVLDSVLFLYFLFLFIS